MTISHKFGGEWTQEKLNCIEKYLNAYMEIFTKNIKASYFTTTYVDAFAGPGYRTIKNDSDKIKLPLFDDDDAKSLQKGSAQIALEIVPQFNHYIFIDKKQEYVSELKNLINNYPMLRDRIETICDDANNFICNWCNKTDWSKNRSVVFLDPYGMEVEWSTMEAIAKTKAIDLWILFPLGSAINRLLTKNLPPERAWADRLTLFFGTDDWGKEFYKQKTRETLFETEVIIKKETDFNKIGEYFIRRLETIFFKVSHNPLPLCNSKNIPIFLLCFAVGNPKSAPTAIKIAEDIILRSKYGF